MLLPQQGRNHPRDSFKVLTSSGLTSDMRDVTWEMERVPIIAAGLDTGTATAPEAREADWHVRYVPPAPQVQPVPPVTPAMATAPSVMTPVMTSAPPMVAPPPGAMSPSSPPGTENPQIDESRLDSEFLQPGRTRARTKAYHKATTAAEPAEHALYNQRPPNSPPPLPACHARELSELATYQGAMDSEYSALGVCDKSGALWASRGGTFRSSLPPKRREGGIGQVGLHVEVR